jgi:ABC-type transport system involved in multi-copper enzyme maturation permease subunit
MPLSWFDQEARERIRSALPPGPTDRGLLENSPVHRATLPAALSNQHDENGSDDQARWVAAGSCSSVHLSMVLATLIAREMRSASRQPFTYHVRVLAAAALLGTCVFIISEGKGQIVQGGRAFARLHATLLVAIWVLVPLLTADCISRERRERTLPLLFLTSLKHWQIVLAKGMAHALSALTLWLAVLPVLAIPFVVGGVSWLEMVLSILLSFSSICLAMGAGMVASASARVSTRALVLAACLCFLFFFGFAMELGFLASGGGVPLPFAYGVPNRGDPWAVFGFGLGLALDWDACWQMLLGVAIQPWLAAAGYVRPAAPLGTNLPLLINFGIVALSCLLALVVLIGLAAWNVHRSWREEAPSQQVIRIRQRLCTPMYFKPLFQRWMRWELNHNPIGWLEKRTWSARLVTWSWFAVFICVYSSLLVNLWLYQNGFHAIQSFLAWLLVASVAISSASSFRRERETGFLELLIVSPLREWRIISGRVCALWAQFTPAIILLAGVWLYCASFLAKDRNELPCVLFFVVTLATLPIVGLYESLARSSFVGAFIGTLLLGVVLPLGLLRTTDVPDFLLWAFGQPNGLFQTEAASPSLAIPTQLVVAGTCVWRLHRNLKCRQFALERQPV